MAIHVDTSSHYGQTHSWSWLAWSEVRGCLAMCIHQMGTMVI